jgi:hypothetical protein
VGGGEHDRERVVMPGIAVEHHGGHKWHARRVRAW